MHPTTQFYRDLDTYLSCRDLSRGMPPTNQLLRNTLDVEAKKLLAWRKRQKIKPTSPSFQFIWWTFDGDWLTKADQFHKEFHDGARSGGHPGVWSKLFIERSKLLTNIAYHDLSAVGDHLSYDTFEMIRAGFGFDQIYMFGLRAKKPHGGHAQVTLYISDSEAFLEKLNKVGGIYGCLNLGL